MTTIYVATSGSYSDYSIDAVFSTREKAEQYIARRNELGGLSYEANAVEEWVLDETSPEWLEGKIKCWVVDFARNTADVESAQVWDYNPSEQATLLHDGSFRAWVFADTQERAVKVAMERRSIWLANEGADEMTEDELLALGQSLINQDAGIEPRQKARIVHIGTIDPVTGYPVGWHFNYTGRNVAAIRIDTELGVVEYGGYTLAELAEICERGTL